MSEPNQPGPSRFGDIRDDYDDEFGRIRTPRELAHRRLLVPSIAITLTGILGIVGAAIGATAVAVDFLDDPMYTEEFVLLSFLLALLATGGYLFTCVSMGGVGLYRLRRHRMALFAAYFVTALSLLGFYAVLLFPFGISALIALYGLKARKEFEGVQKEADPEMEEVVTPERRGEDAPTRVGYGDIRDDYDDRFGQTVAPDVALRRRLRIPATVMVVAGALGLLTMLIVSGYQIFSFITSSRYRDEAELMMILLLTAIGSGVSAIMLFGGWCMLHQQRYRWALGGAFILTALSLGGFIGILLYPFGICALILLHDPDVRQAFRRPVAFTGQAGLPGVTPRQQYQIPPTVLLVAGAIGTVFFALLVGIVLWDAYVDDRRWTQSEVTWCAGLSLLGALIGLAVFFFGLQQRKRRKVEPAAAKVVSPVDGKEG